MMGDGCWEAVFPANHGSLGSRGGLSAQSTICVPAPAKAPETHRSRPRRGQSCRLPRAGARGLPSPGESRRRWSPKRRPPPGRRGQSCMRRPLHPRCRRRHRRKREPCPRVSPPRAGTFPVRPLPGRSRGRRAGMRPRRRCDRHGPRAQRGSAAPRRSPRRRNHRAAQPWGGLVGHPATVPGCASINLTRRMAFSLRSSDG